jgi:hypothetical protein
MGPTGLPTRRSSIWPGSIGLPGCSIIARRVSANGILGTGGGILVIKPRDSDRDGFPGFRPTGASRVLAEAGCRGSSPAGRAAPLPVTSRWERTGGADTGLPGVAARMVGFAAGCGVTGTLAICSGLSLTAWCAIGCPLLKTFLGTAVVATVL